MTPKPLLTAALLLSSLIAAHADTTFYINGTFSDGATFQGTLDWAPNGGVLNLAQFISVGITTSSGLSYNGAVNTTPQSGEKTSTQGSGVYLITDSSLPQDDVLGSNFEGTFLCGTAALCGDEIDSQYTPGGPYYGAVSSIGAESVAEGTITLQPSVTAVSQTPEPSSFALLSMGLAGIAGATKRRLG